MIKLSLILSCSMMSYLQTQSQQILYGMTSAGGTQNSGVIFQYNITTSTLTKVHDFLGTFSEGETPEGSLMYATNGMLYGMTSFFGGGGCGTLFRFNPTNNNYAEVFDFNCGSNGGYPYGSPMQASDGKLYGMTRYGSTDGNIFQFDISSNSMTGGYVFSSSTGYGPFGDLVQDSNGKFYGMTAMGGNNNYGVIFEYDPTNSTTPLTVLYHFDNANSGSSPFGSLLKASDGKYYGLTYSGGANNGGTLFQFDISSNIFTVKFDFNGGPVGSTPTASLIQASDGMLYGLTSGGGAYGAGVLFQYNPVTSACVSKFEFGSDGYPNGYSPSGSLKQASDGNLYGLTFEGGANSMGVLFQYNPTTSVFTKKIDFDGTNYGANPMYTALIDLTTQVGIEEHSSAYHLRLSPNPFSSQTVLETEKALNNATLTVINCLGEIEAEITNISGQRITFSRNNLASGLYFARITENNVVVASAKFLIQD